MGMKLKDYSHRDLCRIVASYFVTQTKHDLVCWELKFGTGVLDVLALTSDTDKENLMITIAEVKRSRSDMLADLNAGKMLKYGTRSSNCWLAASKDCFLSANKDQILTELSSKGLPDTWGVMLLTPEPVILRRSKRLRIVSRDLVAKLVRKTAISLSRRALEKGL